MRILIHAVSVRGYGGAFRHLSNFLPALEAVDDENEYFIYVDLGFPAGKRAPNVHIVPTLLRSVFQRLWWDHVQLPRLAHRHDADLIVALLSFGCARPPCKQIAFLRNPLYCEYYLHGLSHGQQINVLLRRWLLGLTIRASHLLVTPSAAARDTIRRVYPHLPLERFHVLPHAHNLSALRDSAPLPVDVQARLDSGQKDKVIRLLYVGHILPYKSLDTLVDAARLLQNQGLSFCMFLTIAREDWPAGFEAWQRRVNEAGLSDSLIALGKVPATAIGHLYRQADILLFPSLCETFGFPLMEAMSFGLPIVAVDTPFTREMCGDAALYYIPFDATGAARAIVTFVKDGALRERTSRTGRARFDALHITWEDYAARCVAMFKEVVYG